MVKCEVCEAKWYELGEKKKQNWWKGCACAQIRGFIDSRRGEDNPQQPGSQGRDPFLGEIWRISAIVAGVTGRFDQRSSVSVTRQKGRGCGHDRS